MGRLAQTVKRLRINTEVEFGHLKLFLCGGLTCIYKSIGLFYQRSFRISHFLVGREGKMRQSLF